MYVVIKWERNNLNQNKPIETEEKISIIQKNEKNGLETKKKNNFLYFIWHIEMKESLGMLNYLQCLLLRMLLVL